MKKILTIVFVLFMFTSLFGCKKEQSIILATTTSTENSGLLDFLLPYFEEETGIEVKVVAVGTGAALEMGRNGEADILMVHDKTRELEFISENYGTLRSDFMFNDFVIVGPGVVGDNTLVSVLQAIKDSETFVSRGDNSGTHSKEMSLWDTTEIGNSGEWYIETGKGMGDTLMMADELQAYTLSDRATFLSMLDNLDLEIVYENPEELKNQYGIMLVNPELHNNINTEEAKKLYDWLISERGQELINQYGLEEYDQQLFFANAPKVE